MLLEQAGESELCAASFVYAKLVIKLIDSSVVAVVHVDMH